MRIRSAVHEILVGKAFIATNGLISQSFVVTFIYPIYVWIALIWCCGNHLSQWQMTIQGSKFLKMGYQVGNSQENSTRSLCLIRVLYIYRIHIVHATSSCPPHFLLKATMLYTYVLTSSSRFFYYVLGLWCHVTMISCASSSSLKRKIKIKIKSKEK